MSTGARVAEAPSRRFVAMRSRLGFGLGLGGCAIALAFAATGCSKSDCGGSVLFASDSERSAGSSSGGAPEAANSASGSGAAAQRAITEADIVQLDGLRLYAMSKSGTLSIIDAATPGSLSLLGTTKLPGEPFEMYRRGDVIIVMTNKAVDKTGKVVITTGNETGTGAPEPSPLAQDPAAGAMVVAVDVSDPKAPKQSEGLKVPGEIADSRTVGDILYLATYENSACYSCTQGLRTLVTSFDIKTPSVPEKVDQVAFLAPPNTSFNAAWSTAWKRSIFATTERLYIGGLSDTASANTPEGVIQVLDITDPTGKLVKGARIEVAGPTMSRWQMDESQGIFRVISQRGAGSTQNGSAMPEIDTFQIASTSTFTHLGHTVMTLPKQEGLKTVRFDPDGVRAYAITFNQTDPLFALDFSDPAKPRQRGELHIPGWTFHLEPKGTKLLGLGLDREDQNGSLNVSVYDVADLDAPKMLQRVAFGPNHLYEDYQITNGVLAEDQDRIQKSFRIFPDGLVVVPFSNPSTSTGDTCTGGGGIQLIDWNGTGLTKRGLITMAGNPRRALRRQFLDGSTVKNDEVLGVSDSNVTAFDIDLREAPKQTADLVIGKCVSRTLPTGGNVGGGGGEWRGRDGQGGHWGGGTCE